LFKAAGEKESIYACYVLEEGSGRLLGAVYLRDLVIADPAKTIDAVMHRKCVSVRAYEPQEQVANKISKYNLLAIPVLEEDGRVVGFVTVDDVIDVLVEEETERALTVQTQNEVVIIPKSEIESRRQSNLFG